MYLLHWCERLWTVWSCRGVSLFVWVFDIHNHVLPTVENYLTFIHLWFLSLFWWKDRNAECLIAKKKKRNGTFNKIKFIYIKLYECRMYDTVAGKLSIFSKNEVALATHCEKNLNKMIYNICSTHMILLHNTLKTMQSQRNILLEYLIWEMTKKAAVSPPETLSTWCCDYMNAYASSFIF